MDSMKVNVPPEKRDEALLDALWLLFNLRNSNSTTKLDYWGRKADEFLKKSIVPKKDSESK